MLRHLSPHAARAGVPTTLRKTKAALSFALLCAIVSPLHAQTANNAEIGAWQFAGANDLAAQAAARDLIERRRGGMFAAPIYTTHIARQYNCSVSATATGNNGVQSAFANSPTVNGASSTATGNANTANITGDPGGGEIGNGQLNTGTITSLLNGGTTATVNGSASQSLDSTQSNSGDQRASVSGTSACAFGMLN